MATKTRIGLSTRRTLTNPEDWWQAFTLAADRERKTLSEYVGDALIEKLSKRERAKLSERPMVGQTRAKRPAT